VVLTQRTKTGLSLITAVTLLAAGIGAGLSATSTVSSSPPSTTALAAPPTLDSAVAPPDTLEPASAESVDRPEESAPLTTARHDDLTAANAEFVETFDGNGGLDRFLLGAYHRDGPWDGDTWLGDHDENCSTPEQKRTLSANDPVTKHVYVCKDHLMTSMGDVSGYSVVWFSPKGTNGQPMLFDRSEARTVSWDVNTTDLGLRQWVEVKILPEGAPPESVGDDFTVSGLPPYPAGSVVHGAGGGDKVFLVTDEDRKQFYLTYNGPGELQYPDRGTDLRTRYPMSMTDNGDGTITWTITDARGPQTFIGKGSFPERFQVVFADHNYTPDKDLGPLGTHTWHWDNIIIG
jgi:hypothetical protein